MAENFKLEQRLKVVEFYYKNQCSIRQTYRAIREIYGPQNRPSELAIRRIINNFRSTYSLHDKPRTSRRKNVRNKENIAAVNESVIADPEMSIRRRSQEVGLCPSTVWNILRKDLCLHPYKIQLVQELKPNDHSLRRNLAEWAQEQLKMDPLFYQKILFSDEAHFWLNGFVNKQNCRIWSESNPHVIKESLLHPQKLTVWCGLFAGGIIGPYFFRNPEGVAVTVNGDRYRSMINLFLFPKLRDIDADGMWFQQDGATCHTATATIELLKRKFNDSIISRNGPVNWPPRSCDLTPLDYFLWGYVKSLVYVDKPTTLEALEANITGVINEITPKMLEKVMKNWTDRMDYVTASRGAHLPDIIFKT
jgi:Helix-turn-helix domain (DUF4817)